MHPYKPRVTSQQQSYVAFFAWVRCRTPLHSRTSLARRKQAGLLVCNALLGLSVEPGVGSNVTLMPGHVAVLMSTDSCT